MSRAAELKMPAGDEWAHQFKAHQKMVRAQGLDWTLDAFTAEQIAQDRVDEAFEMSGITLNHATK